MAKSHSLLFFCMGRNHDILQQNQALKIASLPKKVFVKAYLPPLADLCPTPHLFLPRGFGLLF